MKLTKKQKAARRDAARSMRGLMDAVTALHLLMGRPKPKWSRTTLRLLRDLEKS